MGSTSSGGAKRARAASEVDDTSDDPTSSGTDGPRAPSSGRRAARGALEGTQGSSAPRVPKHPPGRIRPGRARARVGVGGAKRRPRGGLAAAAGSRRRRGGFAAAEGSRRRRGGFAASEASRRRRRPLRAPRGPKTAPRRRITPPHDDADGAGAETMRRRETEHAKETRRFHRRAIADGAGSADDTPSCPKSDAAFARTSTLEAVEGRAAWLALLPEMVAVCEERRAEIVPWPCHVPREDATRMPALQNPAETVLVRPRSGRGV